MSSPSPIKLKSSKAKKIYKQEENAFEHFWNSLLENDQNNEDNPENLSEFKSKVRKNIWDTLPEKEKQQYYEYSMEL